jgi:hypothetical protein
MQGGKSSRSLDEVTRLGNAMYRKHVQPLLSASDDGKFVAVDIDTGEFEIDSDDYTAVTRLKSRIPTAQIWLERAGEPAAYKMRRTR